MPPPVKSPSKPWYGLSKKHQQIIAKDAASLFIATDLLESLIDTLTKGEWEKEVLGSQMHPYVIRESFGFTLES